MDSFVEQALVFLVAAVLLVPIFQKFRFGSVLGYLIAGVLIGPFGLRLISDAKSVMHFAELGVVLLLFVIGLEIRPAKLWTMRRDLFGLGGIQVILTTLVFAFIAIQLSLQPVAAVVIGFALSLSSTAYALQTLTERNELNTDFGRSSVSVLLMQDLLAIPALALIPLFALSDTQKTTFDLSSALLWGALILILIATSRFLLRPLFRLIAATRMRELFTAMTLLIVLGVAALMQKIGLSAALGTFVAGVLLADSEYRHEIEAKIEPFKGLLMGLFFISVGMGVSLDLVFENPLLVLGLSLAYLGVKSLVLFVSCRILGFGSEKSKRVTVTIAQGGEFAFVIFGLALQNGMATDQGVAPLILVVTISMALSPVLSLLNDRYTAMKSRRDALPPQYDAMPADAPQVIIAGYGRFGQVFGRILRAQNVAFVAIDHDPEHIELVRKFGSIVYYGDASSEDLLKSAGADKAKYFIVAIDDVEMSVATVKVVRERFPNLTIFARARNRGHVFELLDLGVSNIKRETFDSSANFVADLLVQMGLESTQAHSIVDRFKRHDEIMMREQHKVRADDKSVVSLAKQSTAQLAQVLADDNSKTYVDTGIKAGGQK